VLASIAAVVAAGGLLAGLLSGQTSRHATTAGPLSSAVIALTRDVDCPLTYTAAVQVDAFHAVAAITCYQETRELPGQGEWLVSVRRVATSGVPALQAALELPNQSTTDGGCDLVGIEVPPIVLVDAAGHAMQPTVPVDGCHQPLKAFWAAIDQVTWHEVEVRPIRSVVTPGAQAAQCQQEFKNMTAVLGSASGTVASSGGPIFDPQVSAVRVCLYQATGSGLDGGTFERGVDLSAADTRKLLAALTGPGRGTDCPAQRQFAAITAADGEWATVELGGCWRVARSSSHPGIGSANASVVSALLGLR
jgi:hypothetical protein